MCYFMVKEVSKAVTLVGIGKRKFNDRQIAGFKVKYPHGFAAVIDVSGFVKKFWCLADKLGTKRRYKKIILHFIVFKWFCTFVAQLVTDYFWHLYHSK